MREAEFQKLVAQAARVYGWKRFHTPCRLIQRKGGSTYHATAVDYEGAGWPDLILVRGARGLAVELKVGRNRTSSEQEAWLADLARIGMETYVWRPEDWTQIEEVLSR